MFDYSHLFRVCYDRAPKHRLALTFILSALWHGVYPGYYFTFITAIPITMAARAVSTLPPLEIQINTSSSILLLNANKNTVLNSDKNGSVRK